MPVLNIADEAYTVRVTAGENNTGIQAIIDTSLGHTVIETTACTNCASGAVDTSGAGLTASADVASGTYMSPSSTYEGVEGTATLCIYEEGIYSTTPDNSNVGSMPCIQSFPVHFAETVATPNENANVHLGAALGLGADKDGATPDATDNFMTEFVSAGKLSSGTTMFALALTADDGNGSDASLTTSFMDLGSVTTSATDSDVTKATIQFDDNEFYWKTDINGIGFGPYTQSENYGLTSSKITVETASQCL